MITKPVIQEKKKGPGRPSIRPSPPTLERRGIVDSPKNPHNRLEFVYGDPLVFKSLFTYFKNIKARDIHLRCHKNGITFYTRDHSKTSRIVAEVSGDHVNWHYCEGEYWLGINRDSIEKIFSSIDKTFFKITIIQTHDDIDSLLFVFKDADIDKECNYKISLSTYPSDEELYEIDKLITPQALLNNFPIEFTLTAKQFKKSISDASNFSDMITFEKLGIHPLQLTYAKSNLIYNEVYRSPEKIKLRSSIQETDIFRTTIKLLNIKSLAASMVTDDIRILCREDADILFRSAIDEKAIVVSTITKIQ
jgi:hypothetical protein